MSYVVNTSLTAIMPKILARGLQVLRARCIMPRLVNSDYSTDAAKKGSTVDIPIPVDVGTTAVLAQAAPVAPTALEPDSVSIALDQWYQNNPIGLSDKELCEIDANEHFLPMQLEEAVKALARRVNQFMVDLYKGSDRGVYGFTSNPSVGYGAAITEIAATGTTDTSGVSVATMAKKVLNQQKCPRIDRRGLVNFDGEAALLNLAAFSDAEKIMSAAVKMEGEVGRKFGIDWVADDDTPNHTVGDEYEASPTNLKVSTQTSVGDTTIVLKDGVASSTYINRGDILIIGTEKYVVCGGTAGGVEGYRYVLGGGVFPAITIYPAMASVHTVNTVVAMTNSHTVNMCFHRDAFGFATRPLLANSSQFALGNQMLSMQDPVTGLILRLEVSRQHKQTVWEFDILYGGKCVRPEYAMRILGKV